jgi:hypothetical protein
VQAEIQKAAHKRDQHAIVGVKRISQKQLERRGPLHRYLTPRRVSAAQCLHKEVQEAPEHLPWRLEALNLIEAHELMRHGHVVRSRKL